MSGELCTAKTTFSCLMMSALVMFISFVLSHPLYFSYFIFFSPYLVKLICFLSPLFTPTVLVSVALFTSTELVVQSPVSHLVVSCSTFLDRLGLSKIDSDEDDHQTHVDILLYEILFGSSVVVAEDNHVPVQNWTLEETSGQSSDNEMSESTNNENLSEDLSGGDGKVEEKTVLDPKLENASRSSNFLKILDGFERMSCDVEDKKKVKPTQSAKDDKVVGKGKQQKAGSLPTNGSEAKVDDKLISIQKTNSLEENATSASKLDASPTTDLAPSRKTSLDRNFEFYSPIIESPRTMDCGSLGTYGSMRKEKEWKRTLACKLFEERHNVDGGEGMDSLWETYEVNSDKQKQKHEKSIKGKNKNDMEKKNKKTKKSETNFELEDDEEQVSGGGQLCCLQAALKLSTGKMNLGMGRPNLVKISKAIKGFGWLHHASKHSKKVHNI